MIAQPSLVIIGGASLDILHFQGRTEPSIGGAGLYTALAARRAGARVTMFAPRPEPMHPLLAPVAERVNWIGPLCAADDLPSFEIAHYGNGRAELVNARWGAEARLTVENLPEAGLPGDLVYCGPLADPARQLAFIRHFKSLGRRTAVGTYGRAVKAYPEIVRRTLEEADIFFCNENEANGLFGNWESAAAPPHKLLFITHGERGAAVVQGDYHTHISGVRAAELDPTGAGDTFCGTALALLAQGAHPVEAARQAVAAAAEMVTAVGPTMLLRPSPPAPVPLDARVRLNESQIERVAALIAALPEVEPFSFVDERLPPPGHPGALDYFFAATLQQFGFWSDDGRRYREPLVAALGGQTLKGSDYLWAAYRRWWDSAPEALTPAGQARLTPDEFARRLESDAGGVPLAGVDLHFRMAQSYGRDMSALGWTAGEIVARANASSRPLQSFLTQLDHVGGYKEDPLRKKSALLAIILQQRPERFLRADVAERTPPIIDYHLQRSCLRIGLIDVADEALRRALVARELLSAEDEWAVRRAAHAAIERTQRLSGKSMGAVDWFFFGARRRCPEMTEPECARCAVDPVCAHRKELFQPVMRTTFY
jgi:sugar/nucleoside kinase (ribokinase family)